MGICSQSNACVAYIYFDYKNGEAQTGDFVVRTILKQVLLPLDMIPPNLEAIYDDCCSRLKSPEKALFIRPLLSAAGKFSSVYIMLDALDECTSGTLKIRLILFISLKIQGLKFFALSAPSSSILETN